MMKILLTNDDGIYAPGIAAIAKTLTKIAMLQWLLQIVSVARSVTQSLGLIRFGLRKLMRMKKFFGYAISGTPADCVKFGIDVILKSKPDLVISGINLGDNDGCSVYSGTVAGAREGALLGIPSMAVSLATFSNPDFTYAAKLAVKLAQKIFLRKLP